MTNKYYFPKNQSLPLFSNIIFTFITYLLLLNSTLQSLLTSFIVYFIINGNILTSQLSTAKTQPHLLIILEQNATIFSWIGNLSQSFPSYPRHLSITFPIVLKLCSAAHQFQTVHHEEISKHQLHRIQRQKKCTNARLPKRNPQLHLNSPKIQIEW